MKSASGPADATHFVTTRWHLLVQPGQGGALDAGAETAALGHLAQTYWRPIWAIIVRRGYSPADAQDLTQDFFVAISQGKLLQLADPERGRFRSLLRRALQNFVADRAAKRSAVKRGGQFTFLPWEEWMSRTSTDLPLPSPAFEAWPDDRLFDAGWAMAVAAEALRQLRVEYEASGRRGEFEILSKYLTAERSEISYGALGEALQAPAEVVKRRLRQMRVRYRNHLRTEVAATVHTPAEIEDEIRYLCVALSAAGC